MSMQSFTKCQHHSNEGNFDYGALISMQHRYLSFKNHLTVTRSDRLPNNTIIRREGTKSSCRFFKTRI